MEKRRRWQFSEPAERSRRREGGLVRKPLTDTWVERGDRGWARLYGALSTTGHPALLFVDENQLNTGLCAASFQLTAQMS